MCCLVLSIIAFYNFYTPSASSQQLISLRDKVVVICGASSGIGEATAYKYAEQGAQLVLVARRVGKLEKVKGKCLEKGSARVEVVTADFSQQGVPKVLVEQAVSLFGRVDIVVLNHAAIPIGAWLAFEKFQLEEYVQNTFQINTLSYIQLARHFIPHLEKTGGHIMVTSSLSAECPSFIAGLYTSTKFALNGFFYSLQQEFIAKKSNVTLSIVTFGLIVTDELGTMLSTDGMIDLIPNFFKGDLAESAEVIVHASLTKPFNVDYPIIATKIARWMFFFNPWYHTGSVAVYPMEYQDIADKMEDMSKVGQKVGYQVNNLASN